MTPLQKSQRSPVATALQGLARSKGKLFRTLKRKNVYNVYITYNWMQRRLNKHLGVLSSPSSLDEAEIQRMSQVNPLLFEQLNQLSATSTAAWCSIVSPCFTRIMSSLTVKSSLHVFSILQSCQSLANSMSLWHCLKSRFWHVSWHTLGSFSVFLDFPEVSTHQNGRRVCSQNCWDGSTARDSHPETVQRQSDEIQDLDGRW